MKRHERLTAIEWLHRYILRGFGWVFLLGVLFALYMFFRAGAHR